MTRREITREEAGIARLTCTSATKQQHLPSALNDAPLFERSASLERLDSFAYFSHQGEK
jgi:hypothetical protein